jgi:hypothetical protein
MFSVILYMLRQTVGHRAPLLLFPSFFPLLLWRFLSSQLFCVHYTSVSYSQVWFPRYWITLYQLNNALSAERERRVTAYGEVQRADPVGCCWINWHVFPLSRLALCVSSMAKMSNGSFRMFWHVYYWRFHQIQRGRHHYRSPTSLL